MKTQVSRRPALLISCDVELTDAEAETIRARVERWAAGDGSIVIGDTTHVIAWVRGRWRRICHDHEPLTP